MLKKILAFLAGLAGYTLFLFSFLSGQRAKKTLRKIGKVQSAYYKVDKDAESDKRSDGEILRGGVKR